MDDVTIGSLVSPTPDTETLLERTGLGDRGAFASLYDRLASAVYGVALRIVVEPGLAGNTVQEALLGVWSTAARYDRARGSASGWILSIAHRRAVDVVRQEQAFRDRVQRAAVGSMERPFDGVAEEVSEDLRRQAIVERVRAALVALTELQRQAITMAYYGGLTHKEVAQALELPLGTAKTRIRDGMLRLTAELNRSGGFEPI